MAYFAKEACPFSGDRKTHPVDWIRAEYGKRGERTTSKRAPYNGTTNTQQGQYMLQPFIKRACRSCTVVGLWNHQTTHS